MNGTPIPSPETHLAAEAIYALLDGRLEPAAERVAEAHLWRCDPCRTRREECAALLSSLRWYGADPPAPPEGYWDEFWRKLPLSSSPPARRRVTPVLALAASIAILLVTGPGGEPASDRAVAVAPSRAAAPGPPWASEYRLFEQARATIGSADPLSKGIILASLTESD